MKELGIVIQRRREEYGISRAQLAARTECHAMTIRTVERGGNATLWVFLGIAKGLGTQLSLLVGEAEQIAANTTS